MANTFASDAPASSNLSASTPVLPTGTWDFKWPQGKAISVAFQRLPERIPEELAALGGVLQDWRKAGGNLESLIRQFESIAQLWLPLAQANIQFDFSPSNRLLLPAPEVVVIDGVDGKTGQVLIESPIGPQDAEIQYDVLVSFMPLPVRVKGEPSNRATGGQADPVTITGQVSVLGSYATRLQYGVPTTLLGPNVNFLGGRTLSEYFSSQEYVQIVLHEVGHILGFAHEHQNPLYRDAIGGSVNLKSVDSLRTDVFANLARPLSTEFGPGLKNPQQPLTSSERKELTDEVGRELRDEWPHLAIQRVRLPDVPFSDWRQRSAPTDQAAPVQAIGSVMEHPGWANTLVGSPALSTLQPLTAPSSDDLAALAQMYPPR